MSDVPVCPQCGMGNTYPDGTSLICADCAHEWLPGEEPEQEGDGERIVKDAYGNVLNSGDAVVLVKTLKPKGTSTALKAGTVIKKIRIVEGDHEVDCKIDGVGYLLKACFLKKA